MKWPEEGNGGRVVVEEGLILIAGQSGGCGDDDLLQQSKLSATLEFVLLDFLEPGLQSAGLCDSYPSSCRAVLHTHMTSSDCC